MKPILFNTEMVQAILENRKTVTRRLIKPQPRMIVAQDGFGPLLQIRNKGVWFRGDPNHVAPYQLNDTLYVREAWKQNCDNSFTYRAGNKFETQEGWKPSIHMPKEAARIFLRVTDIEVERLRDIDDEGIAEEGLEIGCPFEDLWDSTIKKSDLKQYGWEANPWVWIIGFKRIDKENVKTKKRN